MTDQFVDRLKNEEYTEEEILSLLEAQLQQDSPTQLHQFLKESWEMSSDNPLAPQIKEETWQKILPLITENPQSSIPNNLLEKRKKRFYIGILAFSALILGLVMMGYLFNPNEQKSVNRVSKSSAVQQIQEYDLGGKISAKIAKGSTLDFKRPLVGAAKFATLSGEAFFQMSPDSNQSLSITAGPLFIEAIGARVNIEALPKGDQIRVSVLSGNAYIRPKQKIDNEPSRLHLVEGDELRYNAKDHYSTVYPAKEEVLSWMNGELVFNNHSLEATLKKVALTYDVDFEYNQQELKNCRSNRGPKPIVYEKELELDKVLKSLLRGKRLKYEIQNKKVVISGKGC